MRPARHVLVFLGLACAIAGSSRGADVSPEIFASAGVGRLFRIEDRSYDPKASLGGGAGVRIGSRLGVEGEFHQLLGLSREPAACGVVSPPCAGSAREGFRSAKLAGANVLYFFGQRGPQFYLTGGVGGLWTEETTTIVRASATEARIEEVEHAGMGFAWNLGAGVRIPLTAKLALRPEFRIYDASAESRANLGLIRASIALGYCW